MFQWAGFGFSLFLVSSLCSVFSNYKYDYKYYAPSPTFVHLRYQVQKTWLFTPYFLYEYVSNCTFVIYLEEHLEEQGQTIIGILIAYMLEIKNV